MVTKGTNRPTIGAMIMHAGIFSPNEGHVLHAMNNDVIAVGTHISDPLHEFFPLIV